MIVEDGTGVTGANALISVAEFDQLALDRNEDITAYDTSQKEGAIVIASVDYIDTYSCVFPNMHFPFNGALCIALP